MLIHAAVDNDLYPPLFGGTQRSFGLYRGLARRHAVRVLCVVPNRAAPAAETVAEGVALVRRKAWYTSAAWRLERAGLAPLFLAAYGHRARVGRLLESLPGHPDVLAADLNLAGLLGAADARLRVYTSHNVEYDYFRHIKSRVVAAGFWAERLRRLEARAVEQADLTVVCGEEDARRMDELYGASGDAVAVIPNGFDETRVPAPDEEARVRARATLGIADHEYAGLFLGSDTSFNRQGLRRLLEDVMPRLASGGFRLLVVGGVVGALGPRRPAWLIAQGETERLAPFLLAADAGLNPVTTGGGSNVKLPTYLGAGLAVVTTAFGLRGYASLREWASTAEPDRMAEVLRERPRGWRSRGLARPPAIEAYAWGRLGERLGAIFEGRLSARGAGPAGAGAHRTAGSEVAGSAVPRAREAGGGRT